MAMEIVELEGLGNNLVMLGMSINIFSELDYIVIDDREQEAAMETPLVNPHWITGDLTELVCHVIKGRSSDEQKTAFIFRGLALGDLAVSALAYQTAQRRQIGFEIKR